MTINWTSRRPLCFVPGRCNFIVLQPAADLSCINIARMEFLSRARHAQMWTADCRSRWRLMSSAALDKLSPTSQDLVAALPVFLIFSYWRSVQNISVINFCNFDIRGCSIIGNAPTIIETTDNLIWIVFVRDAAEWIPEPVPVQRCQPGSSSNHIPAAAGWLTGAPANHRTVPASVMLQPATVVRFS